MQTQLPREATLCRRNSRPGSGGVAVIAIVGLGSTGSATRGVASLTAVHERSATIPIACSPSITLPLAWQKHASRRPRTAPGPFLCEVRREMADYAVRTASRRGGAKPRGVQGCTSPNPISRSARRAARSPTASQSETLRIESRSPRAASPPPKADKADRADISRAAHDHGDHAGMLSRLGPALYALALLVEQLTGQKISLLDPSEVDPHASGNTNAPAPQATSAPTPPQPQVAVELDAQSIRYEAQTSTFSANGTVTTADGRQITLGLQATISREFLAADSLSIQAGTTPAKDPLVLDVDGAPTQLSPQRIAFDINADGVVEQVAMPSGGSPLLALDRNANGTIDDGSELFGPGTGSGYGELSALDTDANGWIDSADASFGQLRLWQPNTAGPGSLEHSNRPASERSDCRTPQHRSRSAIRPPTRSSGHFRAPASSCARMAAPAQFARSTSPPNGTPASRTRPSRPDSNPAAGTCVATTAIACSAATCCCSRWRRFGGSLSVAESRFGRCGVL